MLTCMWRIRTGACRKASLCWVVVDILLMVWNWQGGCSRKEVKDQRFAKAFHIGPRVSQPQYHSSLTLCAIFSRLPQPLHEASNACAKCSPICSLRGKSSPFSAIVRCTIVPPPIYHLWPVFRANESGRSSKCVLILPSLLYAMYKSISLCHFSSNSPSTAKLFCIDHVFFEDLGTLFPLGDVDGI